MRAIVLRTRHARVSAVVVRIRVVVIHIRVAIVLRVIVVRIRVIVVRIRVVVIHIREIVHIRVIVVRVGSPVGVSTGGLVLRTGIRRTVRGVRVRVGLRGGRVVGTLADPDFDRSGVGTRGLGRLHRLTGRGAGEIPDRSADEPADDRPGDPAAFQPGDRPESPAGDRQRDRVRLVVLGGRYLRRGRLFCHVTYVAAPGRCTCGELPDGATGTDRTTDTDLDENASPPIDTRRRILPFSAHRNAMSEVLSETGRRKVDATDDAQFYESPRFVTHADEAFTSRLTALYGSEIEPGDRVFDAMSSWVSFLPDTPLAHVVGHGLNDAELEANERLDEYFLQDLNADRTLPLETDAVDVVCCALSVQYLQYPADVFGEFGRVLAADGAAVVSFTDRMFPTKAVRAWRTRSMDERAALVEEYFDAGGFGATDRIVARPGTDPFYAVVGRQPPERAGGL